MTYSSAKFGDCFLDLDRLMGEISHSLKKFANSFLSYLLGEILDDSYFFDAQPRLALLFVQSLQCHCVYY